MSAPSARPRPRRTLAAWLACAALAATSPADAARAVEDRAVRTLPLAPGQALAIAITVGTIRIAGDTGRQDVRLEIRRQAPSAAALSRIPIVWTESPAGPRLAITQPADGADPDLRTDVVVSAPAAARLDALTIAEGRLELRGLHGEVRATVARGGIGADDVSGVLRLETTIGPVEVTRARLAAGGLLRLRAFNGNVRLAFAVPPADTRLLALALNGTIASAVPLTMKDGWGPRWGEATIGQPDRVVSIDVVTGAIRIEAPAAP